MPTLRTQHKFEVTECIGWFMHGAIGAGLSGDNQSYIERSKRRGSLVGEMGFETPDWHAYTSFTTFRTHVMSVRILFNNAFWPPMFAKKNEVCFS